jgi:hypothetical protein
MLGRENALVSCAEAQNVDVNAVFYVIEKSLECARK